MEQQMLDNFLQPYVLHKIVFRTQHHWIVSMTPTEARSVTKRVN